LGELYFAGSFICSCVLAKQARDISTPQSSLTRGHVTLIQFTQGPGLPNQQFPASQGGTLPYQDSFVDLSGGGNWFFHVVAKLFVITCRAPNRGRQGSVRTGQYHQNPKGGSRALYV